MTRRTIVTLPGDGIGAVVLPEAIRVLDAVGFDGEYVHADIGWNCWITEGTPLPPRTVELLSRHGLGLLGAVTSKPKAEADAELAPALRGRGLIYSSPIVELRRRFDLDICIRPCRSFAGNPLNFIRRGPGGAIDEPRIDAVIFRQNTEGSYVGIEWTDPPRAVASAFATHPNWGPFAGVPGADLAISARVVTRPAARRILRAAFGHARERGYETVTLCEKPNVLRETSGMMVDEARLAEREFPGVRLVLANIDTYLMSLTKNPEESGVIVCENLFGDIVSDAFAGLTGGLGFACSANLGERTAVFEPTHGSAPKYAGYPVPIVNPAAMILSAAMLLEHVGEADGARRIREAVADVVREGRVRTFDMLRLPGSPDAVRAGAATTQQMTDAIIARL